jgi:hypothetical protein
MKIPLGGPRFKQLENHYFFLILSVLAAVPRFEQGTL